ncbi:helix-turn-helix transcriptional regulator [Shewanella benthica]|uniref:Phage transcriptional regulator, AlpA n=1 Tax=Shewanella benthica KT99 TaxID=314608 RepID=A9D684_9GAMM|nr:AlpA family phage regulatory protein [Shewanella benthica]EDQ01221.1 phage transcriptional regulator, AlpA [Shewanella benthica KT99]
MNQYQPRIIRKPDVINETGLSKLTLYNRIKDGLFPPPISLGARAVGFVKSECEAVINAMIAEQTPEKIKALVNSQRERRV